MILRSFFIFIYVYSWQPVDAKDNLTLLLKTEKKESEENQEEHHDAALFDQLLKNGAESYAKIIKLTAMHCAGLINQDQFFSHLVDEIMQYTINASQAIYHYLCHIIENQKIPTKKKLYKSLSATGLAIVLIIAMHHSQKYKTVATSNIQSSLQLRSDQPARPERPSLY